MCLRMCVYAYKMYIRNAEQFKECAECYGRPQRKIQRAFVQNRDVDRPIYHCIPWWIKEHLPMCFVSYLFLNCIGIKTDEELRGDKR